MAKLQAAGAGCMFAFNNLSGFVNDSHFKDYLANFNTPKWVYISLATMALITWAAHGRDQNA